MVSKDTPVEGDCDICGKALDASEITRNFHRDSGILTCNDCSSLYEPKHKYFED